MSARYLSTRRRFEDEQIDGGVVDVALNGNPLLAVGGGDGSNASPQPDTTRSLPFIIVPIQHVERTALAETKLVWLPPE